MYHQISLRGVSDSMKSEHGRPNLNISRALDALRNSHYSNGPDLNNKPNKYQHSIHYITLILKSHESKESQDGHHRLLKDQDPLAQKPTREPAKSGNLNLTREVAQASIDRKFQGEVSHL